MLDEHRGSLHAAPVRQTRNNRPKGTVERCWRAKQAVPHLAVNVLQGPIDLDPMLEVHRPKAGLVQQSIQPPGDLVDVRQRRRHTHDLQLLPKVARAAKPNRLGCVGACGRLLVLLLRLRWRALLLLGLLLLLLAGRSLSLLRLGLA